MRRLLPCGLALFAVFCVLPALAEEDGEIEILDITIEAEQDKTFVVHGELRTRYEYLSNYIDLLDEDNGGADDDIEFFPYRARIGVEGNFGHGISAYVELQAWGQFGDTGTLPSGTDPIGQVERRQGFVGNQVDFYQGYLQLDEIAGSDWKLTIGRREHTLGTELMIGNPDFYNGRFFDGARASLDKDSFDLDLFAYKISENDIFFAGPGGVIIDPNEGDDTFYGASANVDVGLGDIEPYILYLRDGSTGTDLRTNLYTIGINWGRLRSEMDGDDGFDWNVELAGQTGELKGGGNPEIDISTSIAELWLGYNFGANRVHIGYLLASGQDPNSNDIESFIPLFDDPHAYNRLGNLDLFGDTNNFVGGGVGRMTNVQDVNLGYERWLNGTKHYIMIAFHWLTLAETLAGASDEIGLETDLVYAYNYSSKVATEFGYSFLTPGDAADEAVGGSADNIARFWAQIRARW